MYHFKDGLEFEYEIVTAGILLKNHWQKNVLSLSAQVCKLLQEMTRSADSSQAFYFTIARVCVFCKEWMDVYVSHVDMLL